jgi:hypothetical protein
MSSSRQRAMSETSPSFQNPRRSDERDIEAGTLNPEASNPHMNLTSGKHKSGAWYTKIGGGMWKDIEARAPYYKSDWTDAWNYRVVPATWVCYSGCVMWEEIMLI